MNQDLLREFEELKRENEKLKQRLSKLEKGDTIDTPVSAQNGETETQTTDEWLESDLRLTDSDRYNDIHFEPEYGVLVCSMVAHTLVLREQQRGGREYIFSHFGEKQHIPYESMKNVYLYNKHFHESGVFAILDKKFLAKYGVKNTPVVLGTMSRIVEGKLTVEETISYIQAMPDNQREEVYRQMVQKLMENPKIYKASFLARIEADLGWRLREQAEDSLEVRRIYQEEGKRGK